MAALSVSPCVLCSTQSRGYGDERISQVSPASILSVKPPGKWSGLMFWGGLNKCLFNPRQPKRRRFVIVCQRQTGLWFNFWVNATECSDFGNWPQPHDDEDTFVLSSFNLLIQVWKDKEMQILQSSYTFSPPKMLQTVENIWYIWHIDGCKYFNKCQF